MANIPREKSERRRIGEGKIRIGKERKRDVCAVMGEKSCIFGVTR